MRQQRVQQRARSVLRNAGCDTWPGGLLTTSKLVVFVADVERQVLGGDRRCAWFAFRKLDGDASAALHPRRGARDRTAVDGDRTGVDQALQPVARDPGDVRKVA